MFQAAVQLDIKDPQISAFNFREALNKESTTNVEGKINVGQDLTSGAAISFQVMAMSCFLLIFLSYRAEVNRNSFC